MILVEKHIINSEDIRYKEIDNLSFKSKNLYNACNYVVRQNFFNFQQLSGQTNYNVLSGKCFDNFNAGEVYNAIITSGACCNKKYINNVVVDKMMIQSDNIDYRALPAKVSKQVLLQLNKNWISFFEAIKEFSINPKKFTGRPGIPKYKDKNGRNDLTYELGTISKKELKKGIIKLSGTNISVPFINKDKTLKQVKITKNNLSYTISILYEILDTNVVGLNNRIAAVDLGINNLLTITDNCGERPKIINGKPIKSINQYYNKMLSIYKSELPKGVHTSKKIKKLTDKRNQKLMHEVHRITDAVTEYAVKQNYEFVAFGYNEQWKTECNMGKKTNQKFANIPFLTIINQSKYKMNNKGILVDTNEEAYTSKCSALDNEEICKHEKYMGSRVKRGVFKTSPGLRINADVNGSFNILRKVVPEFIVRNRGLAVSPVKVTFNKESINKIEKTFL